MEIKIGRFPDKRLKMVKEYTKEDVNIRINRNRVSICPKISEVELEKDVLEAINVWNLMYIYPDLRRKIREILKNYFPSF